MTRGWQFRAAIVASALPALAIAGCGPDNAAGDAGARSVAVSEQTRLAMPASLQDKAATAKPVAYELSHDSPDTSYWGPPAKADQSWFAVRACTNMGNALDAPEEGAWGWTIETDHFRIIADAGFDTVRIPVRWSAHTGPAPEFTIDPAFRDRVDTVLREARQAGLNVIFNVHHFNPLMADPAAYREQLMAIWRQLSPYYRNLPSDVYLEILNEPHGKLKGALMRELLVEAVAIVREHHPDRAIILGGDNYSKIATLKTLPDLDDPRIVPTFHYYRPFNFTHQDAPWLGENGPRGPLSWGGERDEADLVRHAVTAGEYRLRKDVPLLMGEFGVYDDVDLAERVKWTKAVRREFEAWGVAWCTWNFTATFEIWDRKTQDWVPGMLDALGLSPD